jgi:hypothetical protein
MKPTSEDTAAKTGGTTPSNDAPQRPIPAQTARDTALDDTYPLLPADARITTDPSEVTIDGVVLALNAGDTDRFRRLTPSLAGRVPLAELPLPDDDAALVRRLLDQGILHNLHVSRDSVHSGQFCDYLYARIGRWRTRKAANQWPWREVIAGGGASISYLQGLLIENYHYVRAAAVRQSPLLSRAASPVQFDLIRQFVTGEARHEWYFAESLTRWGVPESAFRAAVPLASTAGFIGLQYRLAHRSLLDYLAGSAVLEVDPDVYATIGDPYQSWETIYGVEPEILAPVRQHIRDDVLGGHASLFRQVALDEAPEALPLETALGALASARAVFDATRLWQRDMYEHYQLGGGSPAKAAL